MNNNEIPYSPECEKLSAVHEKSQELGLFLDWVLGNFGELCKWQDYLRRL